MSVFLNSCGKPVLMNMVKAIQENKAWLSEIDGLIGDGDHGVNMNKGFTAYALSCPDEFSFSDGLYDLSMVLLNDIGGSMGPIYSSIFMGMVDYIEDNDLEEITLNDFASSMKSGLDALYDIVDARVGDKTIVDTIAPAVASLEKDAADDVCFSLALEHMKNAAVTGRDSTKDLVAKYGRSSRLGERSRGVLDAGACSCCLILSAMADMILSNLKD